MEAPDAVVDLLGEAVAPRQEVGHLDLAPLERGHDRVDAAVQDRVEVVVRCLLPAAVVATAVDEERQRREVLREEPDGSPYRRDGVPVRAPAGLEELSEPHVPRDARKAVVLGGVGVLGGLCDRGVVLGAIDAHLASEGGCQLKMDFFVA
jgi:hypothetical protein